MAEDMGRDDQRDWGGNTGALGGYGSAGLYSRRRQMERTSGGSYLHQSDVASGRVGGGYAPMPSRGPNPIVKSMPEGKRSAPIMPATVKGVAPNFNAKPPSVPNWGAMGGVASVIGAAGGALVGRALGRRGQGEEEKKPAVAEVPLSGTKEKTRWVKIILATPTNSLVLTKTMRSTLTPS
jgi:hypothetical protein